MDFIVSRFLAPRYNVKGSINSLQFNIQIPLAKQTKSCGKSTMNPPILKQNYFSASY